MRAELEGLTVAFRNVHPIICTDLHLYYQLLIALTDSEHGLRLQFGNVRGKYSNPVCCSVKPLLMNLAENDSLLTFINF